MVGKLFSNLAQIFVVRYLYSMTCYHAHARRRRRGFRFEGNKLKRSLEAICSLLWVFLASRQEHTDYFQISDTSFLPRKCHSQFHMYYLQKLKYLKWVNSRLGKFHQKQKKFWKKLEFWVMDDCIVFPFWYPNLKSVKDWSKESSIR